MGEAGENWIYPVFMVFTGRPPYIQLGPRVSEIQCYIGSTPLKGELS